MVETLSPLGDAWRPGRYGNTANGTGVRLFEMRPGSIVQVAAWSGREKAALTAIRKAAGIALPDGAGAGVAKGGKAAFGIGPGRFLVVDQADGLLDALTAALAAADGAVTGLSHGRTAVGIDGPRVEWVLAKLFPIDFALVAFPVGSGRATAHHDVLTLVQRTTQSQFVLYVYRSFARSFWKTLCHAAEEVGYEVA
ncbi:MAG: sarcosine oxidase subunit gamma [Rhizobiaceae bacterium]